MTSIFGNICLFLAALLSGVLVSSVFNYKPPHGGDGGVSAFPIWVLLLHVAFLACMTLAVFAIARNGGFDWVSPNKFVRYLLVFSGLLLAVSMLIMAALSMARPAALSDLYRILVKFAIPGIPVILIGSGFILLNSFLRESVPDYCYKWPLTVLYGLSIVFAGAGILEWISSASEGLNAPQQRYENEASIKAGRLQEIEESDVTNDMVRILEFCGALYPPEVREKASAKIKTHPEWQNELIFLLENDHALEAFNFLASNAVEDKNLFLKPVDTGVLAAADWIRHSIQGTSSSGLYHDLFSDEVARVLRTVEKFEGMGVDYLPAVRELRAALDEPTFEPNYKFDSEHVLDNWIKRQ